LHTFSSESRRVVQADVMVQVKSRSGAERLKFQ